MIKALYHLLSVIFIVIIQVSFLSTWPSPIDNINLVLSLVIFMTVIVNYNMGLFFGITSGLFLELYTGAVFGVTTLSLILTVIIINFLFTNFFTNRSLYSLIILGFIGTFGYNLIILSLVFIITTFGYNISVLNFNFWNHFFWQPLLNLLILAVIFFTYYLSTGRLRNIFLFSSSLYGQGRR